VFSSAAAKKTRGFNPTTFLATMGDGRKILSVEKKQMIFAQGDAADGVLRSERQSKAHRRIQDRQRGDNRHRG
jgi:hypothetical protein